MVTQKIRNQFLPASRVVISHLQCQKYLIIWSPAFPHLQKAISSDRFAQAWVEQPSVPISVLLKYAKEFNNKKVTEYHNLL